jgi:hypothetical protein
VIDAPVEVVWPLVRPVNFSYNPLVNSSSIEGSVTGNEGVCHVRVRIGWFVFPVLTAA